MTKLIAFLLGLVNVMSGVSTTAVGFSSEGSDVQDICNVAGVPTGTFVRTNANLVHPYAPPQDYQSYHCSAPDELSFSFGGWVEYVVGNGCCLGVSANWQVPAPPSNTNDPVIGLFDSIQGTVDSSPFIVQAVLGWGCLSYNLDGSCARGGHNWYIETEIKTDCCPYYSTFMSVSQGEYISGSIATVSDSNQCGSAKPNKFVVTATDQTTGQSTQQSFWCYQAQGAIASDVEGAVLELPGRFDYCSQLPSTTGVTFTSLSSTPVTTIWQPTLNPNIPSCNFNIPTPTSSAAILQWTPEPPIPSTPNGPTQLTLGQSGTYTTSATALNANQNLKYQFSWGDGTTTTSGWYASGATASASHSWSSTGTFVVKVRAYDGSYWSDWSLSAGVYVYTGVPHCPPHCAPQP